MDTGLFSLVTVLRFHQMPAEAEQLHHQCGAPGQPLSVSEILRATKKLGLKAQKTTQNFHQLNNASLPVTSPSGEGLPEPKLPLHLTRRWHCCRNWRSIRWVVWLRPHNLPLMKIVPENQELEVEAWLENKDIGFVTAGQNAELKVYPFPFTKYGIIEGVVTNIYRMRQQMSKEA